MTQPSILGSKIGRTGDILRKSTSAQIDDYHQRFSTVSSFYDLFFKELMVDQFTIENAYEVAKEFFGKETVKFVGIDGTEYTKQLFEMIIFYAGAYSCEGTINFMREIQIRYNDRFREERKDISSCVPIYVNKVPEIDQTFLDLTQGKVNVMRPLTEEIIINNSSIANFLMTFAEFYLAYTFASSKEYNIILLDRSLSNTYSSLIYDTSKRRLWQTNCSILNFKVDDLPIDINDLTIARHNIINDKLDLPPARGDYLRYAILNLLKKEELTFDSICERFKLNDAKRRKRAENYIERSLQEGLIEELYGRYRLAERYKSTWSRVRKLVNIYGEHIFNNDEPFLIEKESGKEWITTLDLAFLTLFSLYMLIEECWKNNILVIGITKDTAARDFKNHVIPICINNDIWASKIKQEELEKVPNTDRMLLQSISMFNHDKVKIPWALIEYDAAFIMAIPDFSKRKGYVSGAIKNKITPSQLFLRSFVQLEKAEIDDMLRSNVLAIDRLVYPNFDLSDRNVLEFIHEYGGNEPIKFILYKNNKAQNKVQNLVVNILKSMSSPSIPEVFGYNKALYIADKVAKWHNEEFRSIVDSTAAWILNNKGLRDFVFYMRTFRERRQEFESSRRA